LIGRRLGELKANVQNTGDRMLVGLQLRIAVVGLAGELLNQRIVSPVPHQRSTLAPNETMKVTVGIDPIPHPDEIQDMTLELYALKLK
jgi:hypothetical protein